MPRNSRKFKKSKSSFLMVWFFVLLIFVGLIFGLVYVEKQKTHFDSTPSIIKEKIVEPIKQLRTKRSTREHYEIEIAKVGDYAVADEFKAELALLGFVASIIPVFDNKIRKYQISIGSYSSKEDAMIDLQKLKQNKIIARLVEYVD